VLEEAGAVLGSATPYATLSSPTSSKVMLFLASDEIELAKFVPSDDALDRALLDPVELLSRYYGDKELLHSLIEGGRKQLGIT
jgi:hypothetical protein